MAILKNLIVNGASRFLQKAYFDDIAVSGTTTISDLDAGTLDVSGNAKFNGNTYLYGNIAVYSNAPKINFHYKKVSTTTSSIYETQDETTDKYWLNINNNLKVPGAADVNQLIVNNTSNFGGKVKIDGDVDILGNLRWSTVGEHMTIQNLGGTLLVAPTIRQSNTIKIFINGITGTEVNMTIYDPAIAGTDDVNNIFTAGGASWSAGSLIKVSGKIGECVLGACDGSITTINLQSSQMTVRIIVPNADQLDTSKSSLDDAYTSADITDFSIMMYKVNVNSNLYPIGLVLTSYGDNYKSYIDVLGGTNAGTVARMGNLWGLTYDNYSNNTTVTLDNQWGFYTKGNAYFQGHIETNEGSIGGWKITSDGLSKGTLGTENSIFLVPGGKTTANSIGGSDNTSILWTITSNNTFGITSAGKMYLTDAQIAGWTIDADSIFSGNDKTSSASGMVRLSTANFTRTIDGVSRTNLRLSISSRFGVNRNGVLYASSAVISGDITASTGKIGNWDIEDGKLKYIVNDTDIIGDDGTAFLIPGGATTTNSIGGSNDTSLLWTFTSGNNFGVANTGAMYCTSGKIGGWKIDSDSIFSGTKIMDAVDGLIPAAEGDVRLSTADFSRAIIRQNRDYLRFAIGSGFAVSRAGNVYMNNATANKFITYKALRIRGLPAGGEHIGEGTAENPNVLGVSFDCIRANAYTTVGTGLPDTSQRDLCIGTNFYESSEDEEYGGYHDLRPDAGITIHRNRHWSVIEDKLKTDTNITISSEDIRLRGINYSDGYSYGNTTVTINGDVKVLTGSITAQSFLYSGGDYTSKITPIAKDTEYNLTLNHIYLLIAWHNSDFNTRGAWIIRGGSTECLKLNGVDDYDRASGNNITVNLDSIYDTEQQATVYTVMIQSSSGNSPIGRLLDLG